jgi:hypothetical protein
MRNAGMTPQKQLVTFLLALVALDALAFFAAGRLGVSVESALVCYALVFSQVGLAAIWGGLGPGHVAVRLATVAVIAPSVDWLFNQLHDNDGIWFLLLVAQLLVILLPLLAVRWIRGVQWRWSDSTSSDGTASMRPFQFTLWQVTLLLTGIAVALGIGRLAVRLVSIPSTVEFSWFDLAAIAGGFAISTLLAAWQAFGAGWLWGRFALFILGTAGMAAGQYWSLGGPDKIVALLTAAQSTLLALWLWIIGRIGYRLVYVASATASTASSPP